MRYYYISGEAIQGAYKESFEHIIEAKTKKLALKTLEARFSGYSIEVDTFYETTSSAWI